jgi:hypothetical protein
MSLGIGPEAMPPSGDATPRTPPVATSRAEAGRAPRHPRVRFGILLALVLLVIIALVTFGVFDRVLLWVFAQPGLSIPPAILVLILYGLLGNGLGLSKLFLAPSGRIRFLGGLSSALFVALVIIVSYLIDDGLLRDNTDFSIVLGIYKSLGLEGLLNLKDPYSSEEIHKPSGILWRLSAFLWLCLPAPLVILLIPGLPFRVFEGPMTATDTEGRRVRRFVGWALGLALGAVLAQALLIAPVLLFSPFEGHLLAQGGQFILDDEAQVLVKTFVTIIAITATVFTIFSFLRIRSRNGIRAPVAIVELLGLIVTLYLLFDSIDYVISIYRIPINRVFGRCLVVLAGVGWIAWSNSNPWKLTLPGLEPYYPDPGDAGPPLGLRDLNAPEGWADPATPPPSQLEVLGRWGEHCGGGDGRKPKLVVVAVSGGALRSAVWTALMLEQLERGVDGNFGRHVRLVTGASGGMLGAAAYVAGRVNRGLFGGRGRQDMVEMIVQPKSLDAVAQQLALFDIPSILDPRGKDEDRGRSLEATWHYLEGISFGTLQPDEYDGRLPSLVFTPMLVEDGRRLLISNLDMEFACASRLSDRPAGSPGEPAERPSDVAAPAQAPADRCADPPPPDDRVLSRPAIELRRVFHERFPQIPVSTAVRMSATFPYVSPAVSLPTQPPRSVVDAGYYDNFGVNLACTWISHHRRWLKDNTGGVALIQIRDHHGREALRNFSGSSGPLEIIRRSLAFLSSPVAGYMMSRYATSAFRNDEQVVVLDQYFNQENPDQCGPQFFKTVHLEFSHTDDVALNWQLTPQEVDTLRGAIEECDDVDGGIRDKLRLLKGWWAQDHRPAPRGGDDDRP